MTKAINLLLLLALLAGIGFLAYPTVSDQYTKLDNARTLAAYESEADAMVPEVYQAMLEAARRYNQSLQGMHIRDAFTEEGGSDDRTYLGLLNLNGIMGAIEIPKIGVRLPIYHTTQSYGLARGVGHMEGTSLPIGGPGTHVGLAGHRALPSARLFTDLDQMEVGDLFYIKVLTDTLVYQVDDIKVVLPNELEHLQIVPGEDLVTLVTCTPYGVNTHRLLVRGRRVTPDSSQLLASDAVVTLALWQSALIVAAPVALAGLLVLWLATPRRRRAKK